MRVNGQWQPNRAGPWHLWFAALTTLLVTLSVSAATQGRTDAISTASVGLSFEVPSTIRGRAMSLSAPRAGLSTRQARRTVCLTSHNVADVALDVTAPGHPQARPTAVDLTFSRHPECDGTAVLVAVPPEESDALITVMIKPM